MRRYKIGLWRKPGDVGEKKGSAGGFPSVGKQYTFWLWRKVDAPVIVCGMWCNAVGSESKVYMPMLRAGRSGCRWMMEWERRDRYMQEKCIAICLCRVSSNLDNQHTKERPLRCSTSMYTCHAANIKHRSSPPSRPLPWSRQ